MLKLSENPPILPFGVDSPEQLSGPWWVAHTKSRCEKAFAWEMAERKIGYFLPLVERITISSGKKRRVMAPVFPSYVFFCGDDVARYTALTTDRLCQVLQVVDQAQLISELSALNRAIRNKMPLDAYAFAVVGRRCRVTKGPLQGIEGPIIQRNGVSHLILEVKMLGQAAILQIDADLLEPVD